MASGVTAVCVGGESSDSVCRAGSNETEKLGLIQKNELCRPTLHQLSESVLSLTSSHYFIFPQHPSAHRQIKHIYQQLPKET